MKYKCASFFAGVGGIDLGFELAKDFEVVYANEIDQKAIHTYEKNFPIKVDNRDIHDVVSDLKQGIEPDNFNFNILLAGFPCQAFSIAGYQEGFSDKKGRGELFFEIMEIVRIKNPDVVFLENVKNLQNHDHKRTYSIIKQTLEDEGYHVSEDILNTMDYGGIPQNRERMYIVAFKEEEAWKKFSFKHIQPVAIKKQLTEIIDFENKIEDIYYYTPDKFKRYDEIKDVINKKGIIYQWRRVYVRENKKGVCPTLTANMGTGGHNVPLIKTTYGIRKLTPRECFSLQGFPMEPQYILPDDLANCHLYKQAGNSVSVPVITQIAKEIKQALMGKDVLLTKEMSFMFFEQQPSQNRMKYIQMLQIIGSLSRLFSESESPNLYYRAHENIFCKYLEAENLARHDCSADAKKDKIGIGLKTWVGADNQKVAEFGKAKHLLDENNDIQLIKQVADLRNKRINVTKRMYGIETMLYHIVKRIPYAMQIYECTFDEIDIQNIDIIPDKSRSQNVIYFTDQKHTYNFNKAKTTLYMIFDNMQFIKEFEVNIMEDPYDFLENAVIDAKQVIPQKKNRQLCLPLYVMKKEEKIVPEKNGINLWNAGGRQRNPNEISISFHAIDRHRKENQNFFPPKGVDFKLILPDGNELSCRVCSGGEEGKEIMSNPNSALGKWLLRDVLQLEEGVIIDYDYLAKIGIDAVIFEKIDKSTFKIDFSELGTYEKFYEDKQEIL